MVAMQRRTRLIIMLLAVALLLGGGLAVVGLRIYRRQMQPNTSIDSPVSIYIPTNATLQQVFDSLQCHRVVHNWETFKRVVAQQGYGDKIYPGRYVFEPGMSNKRMVNMLRLGWQKPIRLTFNNLRLPEELAGRLARQVEVDSATLVGLLTSDTMAQRYGFTPQTFIAMFVPNTYEVYWSITPEQLFDRMRKEYDRFWTSERDGKAHALGLSRIEVSTVASIVQEETHKATEQPLVARVYLNRLGRGMPLQACPTVKFALRDFGLRRVLDRHLEVESPYNTYRNSGLPPGPIGLASIAAIDAVLNAPQNNYLYFCAKADGSGTHHFSTNYAEHMRHSREYSRHLNQRKIYR